MSKAATTKQVILQKSLELIYKNGYQATSIDDIIATTTVTKGAFFYHFKSKEDMGLALINQVFYPKAIAAIEASLYNPKKATEAVYKILHSLLFDFDVFNIAYGCPVVNLVEEMSPVNESFKKALIHLITRVQQILESAFLKARMEGQIRQDVDCRRVAAFILAGYSGARNMGKLFGKKSYLDFLREIKTYLKNLE
ncbi:TetR/AcrR family transcriptional repressor of nem operon [Pedobacter sp. UYP24]